MEQTVHLMHLCARWREMPVTCDFIATPTFAGFLGNAAAATAAKSLQLCPTLCDPIDGSPPVSPIPGILQARTLEWAAISFSNTWKWKVKVKSRSCVRLFVTPWTAAHQAPLSMEFSKQEYWSGLPFSSPSLRMFIKGHVRSEGENAPQTLIWGECRLLSFALRP